MEQEKETTAANFWMWGKKFFKSHRGNWCGAKRTLQTHGFSSHVSRSGISAWNLSGHSDNFFIYPLTSVSAHGRQLRQLYSPWTMLNCFGFGAETLPHWPSLLQNLALPALPLSMACPLPTPDPSHWLGLCCSWHMSSPLNHIWLNHHPFIIQPIRQHE